MSFAKLAATGLIVAGVLGLIITIASAGSVEGYIKDHYKRVGTEGGATIYSSPKPPAHVASEIVKAHKPADRRVTPDGVFLRYRRNEVGVLVSGSGSRIEVADDRHGYRRFYSHVGGYWGLYSGPSSSFRGGGPGGGGK